MSVLLETSLGDIIVDLLVDEAPRACENFLKLCKVKYYNYSPVYNIQKGFSFQTGDPIGPGSKESDGGICIWGLLSPSKSPTFTPELTQKLKHDERGTVSFACAPSSKDADIQLAGSQFMMTLGENIDQLNGKAAIFGRVAEGYDVLEKINDSFVDDDGRPLKDIRIRHTIVLDDPFPDPPGLVEPDKSPVPTHAQLATVRIADDEDLEQETDQAALEKLARDREAKAQAMTLEMVGDLPFADVKPPENILFVCKLNPVTQDDDLQLLFSRFGKILSCEIIRDKNTGDSLQYAFIEYDNQKDCEQAYFKMQDVLIDDHRIHVDFSQSVSKLSDVWRDSQNTRRRFKKGGFGGVRELEKRRQYREGQREEKGSGRYGMVIDHDESELKRERDQYLDNTGKTRKRSRSPRNGDRGGRNSRQDHRDHRRYDDTRDRRAHDRGGREEQRYNDRGQDRDRHRDSHRRERSRDRYREYDRRR